MVREVHPVLLSLVIGEQPLTLSVATAIREFIIVDRRTKRSAIGSFVVDGTKRVGVTAGSLLLFTRLVLELVVSDRHTSGTKTSASVTVAIYDYEAVKDRGPGLKDSNVKIMLCS